MQKAIILFCATARKVKKRLAAYGHVKKSCTGAHLFAQK